MHIISHVKDHGLTVKLAANSSYLGMVDGEQMKERVSPRQNEGKIAEVPVHRPRTAIDVLVRIIENAHEIFVIINAQGGVTLESPSKTAVLDYPPGYFLGKSPLTLVDYEDLLWVRSYLADTLPDRHDGTPIVFRTRRADGSPVYGEALTVNLLNETSSSGVVLTARYITVKKYLQKQAHATETRYRELVNSSPWAFSKRTPMGVLNTSTGRAGGRDICAVREDPEGTLVTIYELIDAEDRHRARRDMERIFAGTAEGNSAEYKLASMEGHRTPALIVSGHSSMAVAWRGSSDH